jgi:hypothetical protein
MSDNGASAPAAASPAPEAGQPLRTVADLTTDPQNANKGTQRGRAMVASSVRRHGFGRSVLVDKHVARHDDELRVPGRRRGLHGLVAGDEAELVVVQRTDLDLAQPDAQELAVADNRAGEVGLEWNVAVLTKLDAAGAAVQQFWRPPEWAKLLSPSSAVSGADDIPEMGVQPFEHHDYLVVVFTDSQDWSRACELLAIQREAQVVAGGTKKIGTGRVITAARLFALLAP